ncbi:hypothetical protein [uncultured Nostoc sp.]
MTVQNWFWERIYWFVIPSDDLGGTQSAKPILKSPIQQQIR